jgi:hypothetical protein
MALTAWSRTAANNTNANTGINFDENQAPSTVNDSARELEAQLVIGIQDSTLLYLTGVAGTNTITATAAASMAAYVTGQRFHFIPANTNSGATTININSIGAKNIFFNGVACVGNEIAAGIPATITYDGVQFQLATPAHAVTTDTTQTISGAKTFTSAAGVGYNGPVNTGFFATDGTVTGIFVPSTVDTHSVVVGTTTNHPLNFFTNNAYVGKFFTTGGFNVGSPTGGDKGAGTINAAGIYQANLAVATRDGSETLTNKTLTSPTLTTPVLSGTATGSGTLGGSIVVPLARLIRTEVSNSASGVTVTSSSTSIVTLSLGTVNSGDKILITCSVSGSVSGATGDVNIHLGKSSGTGTITFADVSSTFDRLITAVTSTSSMIEAFVAIASVTVTGTITLVVSASSAGSNMTSTAGQIRAIVLNNG